MNISKLVTQQNGTYYDSNTQRCAVFDEQGNQFILVYDYGLESAQIVPIISTHGDAYNINLDGNIGPIVDLATGIQRSLYRVDGTLKTIPNTTPVSVTTWEPIANTLPAQYLGYIIRWNSLTVEPPPAPSPREKGYETPADMPRVTISEDYRSIRLRKKAQSRKFTFYFGMTDKVHLHVQAIRLLTMNPDNSLSYLDDDDADYSAIAGESLYGSPSSLYTGNSGFIFNPMKRMQTHGIVINYPNTKTVSAFEVVVCGDGLNQVYDGRAFPTNVVLAFQGVDGKEHQAAKITGFTFDCAAGESRVLRVRLHDDFNDDIDAGLAMTATSDGTLVRQKIKAQESLSLQDFLTQWLPRSQSAPLADLASAGKTAKEIAEIRTDIPTRYINMAVSARLLTKGLVPATPNP
ncbi:hypothetical protein CCP4SC76_5000010 [Gammaproteobacteria bacterium]